MGDVEVSDPARVRCGGTPVGLVLLLAVADLLMIGVGYFAVAMIMGHGEIDARKRPGEFRTTVQIMVAILLVLVGTMSWAVWRRYRLAAWVQGILALALAVLLAFHAYHSHNNDSEPWLPQATSSR